ncbi:Beta-ketoadipate enol-lactone hydrolase [Granulicella sibirica]|uniref:Beta-ketoadipate enol-lactone hydrolase n=1 Tax=Granulicella sibirica TaxID=2479048 RepID=A0A4Q0T0F5_9BACT|nr:Beta-ketoadipate enol-lactone hydrolase [Granulicella sibirica]
MNWVQAGTEHAETVVLIHAVGYDLTYWDRQIEALQVDYNVVAFDLPGHGRSPKLTEDWTFDDAAVLVADLIERVSTGPVHLVGISFGGMIAQATALGRPDLIRTLTLIGTACTFPEEAWKGMRARAELVRTAGMAAILQSSLERWFTPQTRAQRPDIIDRVTKTVLADDPAVHAAIWEMISGFDVHDRLEKVSCPVLVLVGEQDPSTPVETAFTLANAIPDSKVIVIPGSSHVVTVENPVAVNDALRAFLQVCSVSAANQVFV